MGDVYGWIGLVLGQIVAWPQVLKLRRAPGSDISLLSYGLLLVSMSLYLAHGIEIGDTVTIVSVPLALLPNTMITVTLIRRRIAARVLASERRMAIVARPRSVEPRRLHPEGPHLLADRARSPLEQAPPQQVAGPP